jgi:hypothetical protein
VPRDPADDAGRQVRRTPATSSASRSSPSPSGVTERDWYTWHRDYDEPGTALARRLVAVQDQIRTALDAAPPGPLHAISLCAGQGRDLIGVLAHHPRRHDVTARLVELDPRGPISTPGWCRPTWFWPAGCSAT